MTVVDALSLLIVVAVSAFASSCDDGLGPCRDAQQHLFDCLDQLACGSCPTGPPETTSCEGTLLCNSRCFNDVSCEVIRDAFGGMSTALSQPFRDCIAACQMP